MNLRPRRRPRRDGEPKIDPELWRALSTLLIRLIGETVTDKFTRAILIGAVAATTQLVNVDVEQTPTNPPELTVTVKPTPVAVAAAPVLAGEEKAPEKPKTPDENKAH